MGKETSLRKIDASMARVIESAAVYSPPAAAPTPASGNADTLDGLHASASPVAGYLYPLDSAAQVPAAVLGVHDVLSKHSVTGSAYQIVGLTASNTIGLLTPASTVAANTIPIGGTGGAITWSGAQTWNAGGTIAAGQNLAFGADIALTRGAADVLHLAADDELRMADYALDSDGWRLTGAGHGYFRYVYASELHAKAFVADLEQALAGGQIICKSVAPLAADFTAPAAGANADLTVQEFQGFGGFHVFVDSDIVRIRTFARAGSTLTISDCWGTVVYVSRDATAQTQLYTFTRSAAPNAGTIVATTVIGKGTLALDYGTTGNGFVESVAQSGAMASGVPYHQIVTWATHPATGQTVRYRAGNLNGVYGIASDLFGIGLGDYAAGNYLRYETSGGFLLSAGSGKVSIDGQAIKVVCTTTGGIASGYLQFLNGATVIGHIGADWVVGTSTIRVGTQATGAAGQIPQCVMYAAISGMGDYAALTLQTEDTTHIGRLSFAINSNGGGGPTLDIYGAATGGTLETTNLKYFKPSGRLYPGLADGTATQATGYLAADASGNLAAVTGGNLTLTGHLLFPASNTYDIGDSTNRLKNIYAVGFIRVGRVNADYVRMGAAAYGTPEVGEMYLDDTLDKMMVYTTDGWKGVLLV